jgi:RimJ/RimL family protein N-acetyltransferase
MVSLMNERTLRIRGGERITVRPMVESDAGSVVAGFERLSPTSLRHRFFSPAVHLTPGVAADLTAVDERHVVLLAFDSSGRLVGGARANRHRDDPATAELAVTVGDAHQGRGLGTKLLRLLRTEAKRAGIDRLTGHVLLDNAAGQALLVATHAACWIDEPGVMGFEIPLGRRTVAPEIAARRSLGLAS